MTLRNVVFYDFWYWFRFFRSPVDLLVVIAHRIPRTCKISGATQAVTPDISKIFYIICHFHLLQKSKSYEIYAQGFALFFISQ